tara:strand:+ start:27584 stop:27790 length:207 start_codon:yes stop_codon:yes gene_type:complete
MKTLTLELTDNSIPILKAALTNWRDDMYKLGHEYDRLEMEHNAYNHCEEADSIIKQLLEQNRISNTGR